MNLGDAPQLDVEADPTLATCSVLPSRVRFSLFSRREPDMAVERDIINERPTEAANAAPVVQALPERAVVHTTLGDVVLALFPRETPRTHENFVTHATNGYYDGVIFHRVIRGFMVQTGDPKVRRSVAASVFFSVSSHVARAMARAARAFGAGRSRTSSIPTCVTTGLAW